jgi:predicted secreted hydrolase
MEPHPADPRRFSIIPQGTWRSPHSGAEYPASWIVNVPSLDLTLQIQPLLSDQELNLSFIYWEGAVQISGTRGGQSVTGFGYVELTGYGQSMEDRF